MPFFTSRCPLSMKSGVGFYQDRGSSWPQVNPACLLTLPTSPPVWAEFCQETTHKLWLHLKMNIAWKHWTQRQDKSHSMSNLGWYLTRTLIILIMVLSFPFISYHVLLGWSIICFTARINPDTRHGCHSYMWSGLTLRRGLSEPPEACDSGSHLSLLKSMQKKLKTIKFVFRPETLSEETLNLRNGFLVKFWYF